MDAEIYDRRQQDLAQIRLSDYLGRSIERQPVFNCFVFVADWILLRTGLDPAGAWRRIGDSASIRSGIRAAGGELELATTAMSGFEIIANPQGGDVALVQAPVGRGRRPVAAICVEPGYFAILTDRGLTIAPLPLVRAWRIDG